MLCRWALAANPVTVAVDAEGQNVHTLAPLVWREKIARGRLLENA